MLLEKQPSVNAVLPVVASPSVKRIEDLYVKSVADGNLKFLFVIYTHYSAALLVFIKDIVNDETVAEDVLQLTVIKIWKYAGKYESGKGRLYTWMRRIAKNTALDYLRSGECIRGGQTKSMHEMVDTLNHYYYDHDAEYGDIKRMVSCLNSIQKQVIKLIYVLGYTQVETAQLLAIPLGTVKTHVGKAISKLRKLHRR